MVQVRSKKKIPPTVIKKFFGLNEDVDGETGLKLGESPNMSNWRITDNYKLRKREGYDELFTSIAAKSIQGMWYGKISGIFYFLFACNGHIYRHNLADHVNSDLGTLTDAKTFMFAFNNKVYFLNGTEYKYWDGTTFGIVAGYRPKIFIGTPPAGGGTAFEEVNLLTGAKRQTFSADGIATEYKIAEDNIGTLDGVKVNGVNEPNHTVDLITGKVTFTTAPTVGQDNVEIAWTKGTGTRATVQNNKKTLLFGGANDSRIHIFGNDTLKNRVYFTGLADGVPSAEYFPENNFNQVGSDEFAITDMVRQYDRALIFTENDTWYTYYDAVTTNNVVVASFPVFALNQERGNVAFGQAQLIRNNPFTIDEGVYEWVSTNVRDERNVKYLSLRVQPSLDEIDLTTAITYDWQEMGEYWICVDSVVYIYAYRIDVWYKFTGIAAKCFIVIKGKMYFGTGNGQIMIFGKDIRNDNGVAINAEWEMSFYDFEADWLRKYINRLWLTMKPETRARVYINYETDRNGSSETLEAVYNFANFINANFNHWSFKTNYNPQPFRFKIKAKKFVYFKLILTSNTIDETATILTIDLNSRYGGEAK